MISMQDLKKYFWFVFGIMGVVFFWVGIWDGIGSLPYLSNPPISLAVGLLMFSVSKLIFKDADIFGGEEKKEVQKIIQKVRRHPKKHEFHIKYEDKIKNKEVILKFSKLDDVEKEFLVFLEKGKEIFVPLHRVTEITHKKKTHWKK